MYGKPQQPNAQMQPGYVLEDLSGQFGMFPQPMPIVVPYRPGVTPSGSIDFSSNKTQSTDYTKISRSECSKETTASEKLSSTRLPLTKSGEPVSGFSRDISGLPLSSANWVVPDEAFNKNLSRTERRKIKKQYKAYQKDFNSFVKEYRKAHNKELKELLKSYKKEYNKSERKELELQAERDFETKAYEYAEAKFREKHADVDNLDGLMECYRQQQYYCFVIGDMFTPSRYSLRGLYK